MNVITRVLWYCLFGYIARGNFYIFLGDSFWGIKKVAWLATFFCIVYSKLHTCWQPTESIMTMLSWSSPHPISSSQLHVLPHFHLCPIDLVVFKGVYSFRMGYLILRGASRLDAFSVYPFRAWLPGYRLGSLTGAPAARPSRSSRTKDSSSQISYAHAG